VTPGPSPCGGPVGWARARELAATCARPVLPCGVPLDQALGAVLAEDARARSDLPQRDTSAMDGWAVAGPPPWSVAGEVLAGSLPPLLAHGTATVIATGAVVPAGADGVLRREHGRLNGSRLEPVDPGVRARDLAGDVREAGRECRRGDVVLAAGSRIGPATLGLLAAAGLDGVPVRRPSVDLLVLGDELLDSGPARDGRVRDALGPLLSAWLPALGLGLLSRRRVPDRAPALALALRGCLADVIVTTGSTARGPVDHLHRVLAEAGADVVVDGVEVRPGHPQLLALLPDGRPVIGLPGNPLAAVSAILTLLEPLALALAGATPPEPRSGTLLDDVPAGAAATRLVPVRAGRPVLFAGPAMLRGLATADAVAVIPPGGVLAGTPVELLALP
jgi:molybdopterin molybdotransferase